MEIYNTRPEDAGIYSCKAVNTFGEDCTECLVTVQERVSASYTHSNSTPMSYSLKSTMQDGKV